MNSIVRNFKFNSACIAILALTGNHLHAKEFMTERVHDRKWLERLVELHPFTGVRMAHGRSKQIVDWRK